MSLTLFKNKEGIYLKKYKNSGRNGFEGPLTFCAEIQIRHIVNYDNERAKKSEKFRKRKYPSEVESNSS